MSYIKSVIKSAHFHYIILGLYLLLYLTSGIYTELRLIAINPLPSNLFADFRIYERALNDAIHGQNPYALQSIGAGYLYPPPALLIIEIFSYVKSFYLRVSLFSVINIALLVLMVYGIARYYDYANNKVWYWFVLCLGFAPFLELIHIGQINIITLFGLFMLFFWEDTSPVLSGIGLGIAIITKVTPVLFLGYLIVNRRFKNIAATLILVAILTGLSILRYGFSPVLEYTNLFQWLIVQFPIDKNSQSLVSKLAYESSVLIPVIKSMFPKDLQSQILRILSFFTKEYYIIIIQRILMVYFMLAIIISGLFTFFGKQPKEPLFIVTAIAMLLSPNVVWYHHYVFFLLPLLIWMGWKRLDWRVVTWCLAGLLMIQIDRRFLTYGFLIHIFGQLSLLSILLWQTMAFYLRRKETRLGLAVGARV